MKKSQCCSAPVKLVDKTAGIYSCRKCKNVCGTWNQRTKPRLPKNCACPVHFVEWEEGCLDCHRIVWRISEKLARYTGLPEKYVLGAGFTVRVLAIKQVFRPD